MCRPATVSCGLLILGLLMAVSSSDDRVLTPSAHAAEETSSTRIRLIETEEGRQAFEVSGLPSAALAKFAQISQEDSTWTSTFAVYVVPAQPSNSQPAGKASDVATKTPMAGSYAVRDSVLRFQPRYPLEAGVHYRAVFRVSSAEPPLLKEFEIKAAPLSERTEITAVYPTSDRLPENQLKFYVHFSGPMARGQAYDHLQLLDAEGKPIDLPFLELGEELWNPSGRRFTLLFDPGRIKRGLKPREEAGPVLEEGKTYTLVVDRAWQDAAGRPLVAGFRKTFTVGPPDNSPPDPANWKLRSPAAGSNEPLELRFPESLDEAMLERVLSVQTAEGQRLSGEVSIDRGETRWRFRPSQDRWKAGRYQIVVAKTLEDLAGNSIGRPFEVDELKPVTERIIGEEAMLPFDVK